jgi:hypothetical protein
MPAIRVRRPARYKTRIDFVVPLPPAAVKVIEAVPRIGKPDLLFMLNGRAPISGFAVWKQDFDKKCGVENWQARDLRRTVRSMMSRKHLGIPASHYRRHPQALPPARIQEGKRKAFEALALEIERIVTPPPSNGHQLRA